jgi:hypothetical protein
MEGKNNNWDFPYYSGGLKLELSEQVRHYIIIMQINHNFLIKFLKVPIIIGFLHAAFIVTWRWPFRITYMLFLSPRL